MPDIKTSYKAHVIEVVVMVAFTCSLLCRAVLLLCWQLMHCTRCVLPIACINLVDYVTSGAAAYISAVHHEKHYACKRYSRNASLALNQLLISYQQWSSVSICALELELLLSRQCWPQGKWL